jgi:hypothetical protein
MAELVARIREVRGAYRILVGKPEARGALGKPRHRWEDNIKMDLSEVGWRSVDWIAVVQDKDRWRGSCECGFHILRGIS